MKPTSKCCQSVAEVIDGEYVCSKCWQPCLLESTPSVDWPDVEYERARLRGDMPEVND